MQNDASSSISSWTEEIAHILKASRQALQPGKLVLATVGLIVTFLLGHSLDWIWVTCGSGMSRAAISASPMMAEAPIGDEPDRGVFAVLLEHEKYCLDQTMKAARHFSITAGMGSVGRALSRSEGPLIKPTVGQGYGLIAFILAGILGAYWVLTHHWFFSLVFGLLAMAVWSLAGGGICRISALQFARGRRPPALQALAYAVWKFWHFLLAPLLPLAIILFFVLFLLVGGLVAHVPILGGVLFGLSLLGGAVVALMLIFVVGSSGLMWPAVAIEGIDCTDAIGRAANYLYERMERAVVYALLAIIYGALVWMVARLFGFLLAYSVHGFVGTTFGDLSQMWETPTYDRLYASPATAEQIEGWSDSFTFLLIRTWVGLGGFVLYGYGVSFVFTCSTIIYFLLRCRVDECELDEIYEDKLEPAAQSTSAAGSVSTMTPSSG